MKTVNSLVLLAISASITSCSLREMETQPFPNQKKIIGNNQQIDEKRQVDSYESIELVGHIEVELIAGKEGEITVQGESNLVKFVHVNVKDNQLSITTESNTQLVCSKNKKLRVLVPVESISEIHLVGSGDIVSSLTFDSSPLLIEVTGSGEIDLNINNQQTTAIVTGSGEIDLKGKTALLDAVVSGSGEIEAFDLESDQVKATVAGSGALEVNALKKLDAHLTGSGDIFYRKTTASINKQIAGSGSIQEKNN